MRALRGKTKTPPARREQSRAFIERSKHLLTSWLLPRPRCASPMGDKTRDKSPSQGEDRRGSQEVAAAFAPQPSGRATGYSSRTGAKPGVGRAIALMHMVLAAPGSKRGRSYE